MTERRPSPAPREAEHASGAHKLDAKTLTEIGGLPLRARILADSVFAGTHRSRRHGTSVEFSEHKEYSPGDNVRHLDWRAYARADRDYVKRFEDESHLRAILLVDTSGSMGYQSSAPDRLTKLEYAKTLAGALAYVLARQGDAVGVSSFAESLELLVPPKARRGHLQETLSALSALEARGSTALSQALDRLAEGLSRRTIVAIFSDLLDVGEGAIEAVAKLSARGHDVVLFHVMDPDELDFPFDESTLFKSLEDNREVQIDARAIRDAYLDELEAFKTRVEAAARSARVEYHLVRADDAPGLFLAAFLARRASSKATAR